MRTLQSFIGMAIGGIAAITGIGGLLSSCAEDTGTKITSEQMKDCCGENDHSALFNDCVEDYLKSGVCSKTDPCADGGCIEPPYGIIPHYNECCGVDDGSQAWTKCVEDYQKTGVCSKTDPCADGSCEEPEFPLFNTSDEDARACCGEDINSVEYKQCKQEMDDNCGYSKSEEAFTACIENYKAVNSCSIEPPPVAGYGMPMPTDDEIKSCCGEDDGSEAYDACVEELKDVGYCKQGGST